MQICWDIGMWNLPSRAEWPTCLISKSLNWCGPSLFRARSSWSSSRAWLFSRWPIRNPGRRGVRKSRGLTCLCVGHEDRQKFIFWWRSGSRSLLHFTLTTWVCEKRRAFTDHLSHVHPLYIQRGPREQTPDGKDFRHFRVFSTLHLKMHRKSVYPTFKEYRTTHRFTQSAVKGQFHTVQEQIINASLN